LSPLRSLPRWPTGPAVRLIWQTWAASPLKRICQRGAGGRQVSGRPSGALPALKLVATEHARARAGLCRAFAVAAAARAPVRSRTLFCPPNYRSATSSRSPATARSSRQFHRVPSSVSSTTTRRPSRGVPDGSTPSVIATRPRRLPTCLRERARPAMSKTGSEGAVRLGCLQGRREAGRGRGQWSMAAACARTRAGVAAFSGPLYRGELPSRHIWPARRRARKER